MVDDDGSAAGRPSPDDDPDGGGRTPPGGDGPASGGRAPTDGDRADAVRGAIDALPFERSTLAVLGVAVVALAVRLFRLGGRIMHWDEGRVGYWILRYHETGQYHYRPIVHGPFLPIVNDYVFAVLPPSDFSARLVVALVGGLLPLVALSFRDRLRDDETVALALVLTFNPLLVYYSRFMRNDVLVGGFALATLGLAVLAIDREEGWLGYLAAGTLALAFAAKENALLYVLCFVGAGVLLLDHRLLRETTAGTSPATVVHGWIGAVEDRLRRWHGSVRRGVGLVFVDAVGTLGVFLVVVVFFYAPRPELANALAAPANLPGVVGEATVGSWEAFYGTWVGGGHQDNPYLPYLYDYLETLAYGAPAVLAFAVVGFFADGYGPDGRRALVAFATYWGAVSLLGYPLATDIRAPWAAVHAVVPLSIPAAVGLTYVYRAADLSVPRGDDVVGPILAALIVVVAATGTVGANGVFMNSASEADGEVLQYAQPGNDLKATLEDVERVVERTDDGPAPDVLYVGTQVPGTDDTLLYVEDESSAAQPRVGGPNWHSRLPLPWYMELYGAEVTSTPPDEPLPADPPPVVFAYDWDREEVSEALGDGYVAREHRFRLWNDRIVVFLDRSALEGS